VQEALIKIGSIVLLLGGLIFVHELGHFIVAKALRVKVVRFSIGFGPRLLGFTRGETEYRIAALPLGGYVKMAGDDPNQPTAPEDRGRGFLEQSPGRRFLIAAAGPAANIAFPVLLYLVVGLFQNGREVPGPMLGTVAPGSPAAEAGLRPGDRILSVTAPGAAPHPIRWFSDLRDAVSGHPGEPLAFEVERGGTRLPPVVIRPGESRETSQLGTSRRGLIGVSPDYATALVVAAPGVAGGVEPLDLVVKVAGKPVRHLGELERALAAAGCAPIDLEVLRDRPLRLPGAAVSSPEVVSLPAAASCAPGGGPALLPADPNVSTVVAQVVPGGPAEAAGLKRGDVIAAVNGRPTHTFRELNQLSSEFRAGQPIALRLADGRELSVVPAEQEFRDRDTGEKKKRTFVGLAEASRVGLSGRALIAELVPLRMGPLEIATRSVVQVGEVTRMIVVSIARLITGKISVRNVGGPITLVSAAAQAAEDGWEAFLATMAIISINLGLVNLLPIPVLDGGHIVSCALEAATRRRPSLRAREIANLVGLALLALLMLVAFRNDIARHLLG